MRLNIQALTAGLCLLQLELSAASSAVRDLKIGDECRSSHQCSDCLKCVNGYKDGDGEWVRICQVDGASVGDPCENSFGMRGACRTDGICYVAGMGRDPHMQGLLGQDIDWKGEDGGWYAVLSDTADVQMSVRVTAPLPEEFPDRQLMTGVAIKYEGGHSIVIENKHPYTTETRGCHDWFAPCLSDNALRITVDGVEHQAVPVENAALPGEATMTAVNLPPECQPYGGDRIWAETYAQMVSRRRLESMDKPSITEWVRTWSSTTAAPSWCDKYLGETSTEGVLEYRGKHAAFRIETPAFTVRIHHGTNHQGGEVLYDGRVLPELEFWQIDLHLESYSLDASRVTGMLGETMRPQLDSKGVPIMSGGDAMRGEVEDYRISSPLATDFAFFDE